MRKICRKCGAMVGTPNCCENGALTKQAEEQKPKRRRSKPAQPPVQASAE